MNPFFSASNIKNNEQIFCAWDCETRGLGGELLLISYCAPFARGHITGSPDEIVDKFLHDVVMKFPTPCTWYAHNVQYDLRYIVEKILRLQDRKVEFNLRTESDIYRIKLKYRGKSFIFHDSMAIFPESLKSLAKNFLGPELQKHEIDIGNFNPQDPAHIEYAMRDVDILYTALPLLDQMLSSHFGVYMGHTSAGTAMSAWQRTLDKDIPSRDYNKTEDFIRDAYYGGLVFLTDNSKHESKDDKSCVVTYDINSSYPFCMVNYPMPFGKAVESDNFQGGGLGIYDVDVIAPENLRIPILASRDSRGGMVWRSGKFRTKATTPELIFAVKNGYQIKKIHSGLKFTCEIIPFKNFIEKCKRLRATHKGTGLEKLAKLMQNSLYGKFGARRIRSVLIDEQMATSEDMEGAQIFSSYLGLWVKQEEAKVRVLPEWAVFITAYARLRLLQFAYSVGVEHVLYGDTDSLSVLPGANFPLELIGQDYGQFKIDKEWKTFRAIAPKVYCGQLMSGEWVGKAKGVPRKTIDGDNSHRIKTLYDNGQIEVEYDSLQSFAIGMKKGFVPSNLQSRKSSSLNNSQNYTCTDSEIVLKKSNGNS